MHYTVHYKRTTIDAIFLSETLLDALDVHLRSTLFQTLGKFVENSLNIVQKEFCRFNIENNKKFDFYFQRKYSVSLVLINITRIIHIY